MSGLIVMRTEVKNSKMLEFMDEISAWNMHISKIYKYDKKTEIFFDLELMGYAEPITFYEDIKKYVKDVWFCIVGDSEVRVGKDTKGYGWESCKLKLKIENNTLTKQKDKVEE